jgi:xylan 1,4-beta-xylosidase
MWYDGKKAPGNWHQVDKVYDALLKLGIRPFVELNPMPAALASGTQTMFFYKMNVTPPRSYDEWGYLVSSFVQHLVQRYGLDEVRQWYFEVWNEPNLSAFWSGTQQDYWKLYAASANAIKKIDRQLRVGGPATASGAWIQEIIDVSVAQNLPLDFVSTHLYPQDEQVFYPDRKNSPYNVGTYFASRFREVQQLVKKSKKPGLEIHWTEWNTQSASSAANITWGENIYVDNLFAASFIVRNMIELDTVAHSMAYWVVSDIFDEGGIPQSPFSNTYGLLNIHGIPKASFQAFRLLRKMTGEVLAIKTAQPLPPGKGLLATREGQTIRVLLWNQNFVEEKVHTPWTSSLQVPVGKDSSFTVVKATIGIGAGSAWESWQVMGRPLNPTPTQLDLLRQHAEPSYTMAVLKPAKEMAQVSFQLKPGEVQYLEITPAAPSATTRFVNAEDFKIWDEGMSERTKKQQ